MIVALEGMEFFAHHGVYEEEKEKGNQFLVDLYLEAADAGMNDRLDSTVDYAEAYDITSGVMLGERVDLLERLASEISRIALARMPAVGSVRVRVSKLSPKLNGKCRRSFVEFERNRS